ncbi:hypothetical protein GP486_005505 [Trichoglossum hirsutum]|uniref:Molybdenum cofactor sulfurase n=1 Tax=Trichoglossum hirsutum TaxID=265104 RepID=A0A9P8RML5_9PEZI|nr:hypothetical protein GP486_005505 [Trichoglossum hirsutum]
MTSFGGSTQSTVEGSYDVDEIRETEYPMLKGTTLYAKSLVDRFSADLLGSLYGNPHSASAASQLTARRIEDVRLRVLRFFGADPDQFDVVFVQNATAGVKLVVEGLRACGCEGGRLEGKGFWYGYHRDSHTSLVGVREAARAGQRCFGSDGEVEDWLSSGALSSCGADDGCAEEAEVGLFAYPAQSNMTGRRLPLEWSGRLRRQQKQQAHHRRVYSLLDAAALVSTSPLDLSDPGESPDFTVLSFYKIFGFPDLGALIVRKEAGHVLQRREYFGGGTVEMVVCLRERWFERKQESLHEQLEDGTLPLHNIIALDSAMDVHRRLYGPMENISKHTSVLAKFLYEGLSRLSHANGESVCCIYRGAAPNCGDGDGDGDDDDERTQGPIIAFNIKNGSGGWVSNSEVERLAAVRKIQLRTGGVCNPGGIAHSLGLAPWEMKANFSAGRRCGDENDIMNGKPTGVIRVSLGAMSSIRDVRVLLEFIEEFYVERQAAVVERGLSHPFPLLHGGLGTAAAAATGSPSGTGLYVESLTIYPIKSCGGWRVPEGMPWAVRKEGLAWDREWCLVHLGTGAALSLKRYPQMALVRPTIDLDDGVLRVRLRRPLSGMPSMPTSTFKSEKHQEPPSGEITVPLSANPEYFRKSRTNGFKSQSSRVCGETITAYTYTSPLITEFFSNALGVPCTLARLPASSSSGEGGGAGAMRYSKARLRRFQGSSNCHLWEGCSNTNGMPGAFPTSTAAVDTTTVSEASQRRPILLSNESPILVISRSSLDCLNESIAARGGKKARAEVFRANIVVAGAGEGGRPYGEDSWAGLRIGNVDLETLGACRRCRMVCVDPDTGCTDEEPYVSLARTRSMDGPGGGVFFGVHAGVVVAGEGGGGSGAGTLRAGLGVAVVELRGGG